ncbi:hypothetical protein MalM25_37280 [Planctomycetes bacterium MalM25]|nr:hypothetical protein MalM25_37280 [Planctomycetes bacterium MalM25]
MNERLRRTTRYLHDRLLDLDRLLRGEATRPDAVGGKRLEVSARGMAAIAVLLAMFYGACMGSFSLLKSVPESLDDPYGPFLQVLASTIKTPALFLLTLVVTLPSLYVSNALIGSRLTLLGMTRLLTASIAVNLAVLASLGTIVLFFSLTTNSYPFILLLNVAAFSVAGVLGLMFLLQTLHRVLSPDEAASTEPPAAIDDADALPESDEEAPEPAAIDMPAGQMLGRHTKLVFRCWLVLFSLVGAQMGWVLRPFIGNPELAFSFFRPKESNFFAAVFGALGKLLLGGG